MLGDRFELLAAAQAALVAKIPIAHISGGDSTEGGGTGAGSGCGCPMATPATQRVIAIAIVTTQACRTDPFLETFRRPPA